MKIKGIHTVKRKLADGSTRVHRYAWRSGPKMREKPGTETFAKEWARHKELADKAPTVTLESLIEHFTGTDSQPNPDFLSLAESTRRDHLYAFDIIKKHWPNLPARLTQKKGMKADIRGWHRSYAANPRKADKLLFSMSRVFSYAVDDELIERNPCRGIARLYTGSRRESVWTPTMIANFRKRAHAHLLLPFEIAIGTGQRQGDILALSWRDYDGTYLRFDQSKTDKRLKVRVHAKLKTMLDAMDRDAMRICLNSRSRPWTKDGFKTSWGKECARLNIGGVTFHDLRGTFITNRVGEGSSIEDVARITGHTSSEVRSVLERHYLASDQDASDAVILRMEQNP